MADNVAVTAGSGTTIAADEISDGTLGSVKVQYVKLMDGTLDGTTKATVGASGLAVSAAQSGTWNIGTATTVTTVSTVTNLSQMNGAAITMGNGVSGTGVQRVTIASDSTGVIGATQSGTWTVQPGNTPNTTAWLVSATPATSGGLTTFNATSSDGATALTNSAQAIKASAGQLFGWYIYNPNSSAQFVQLYNTASASVTVGTTNPLFMLTIPATSAANVFSDIGIAFSNAGWSTAATSTAGGNGAPSTALDAVFYYK